MKSKCLLLIVLGIVACTFLTYANEKNKVGKKVQIECMDGMTIDATGKIAIFKKDVVLKQGDLLLKCQKLEVLYDDSKGKKDISILKGYGDVFFDLPDRSIKGTSDTFIYEHKTGRLELTSKNVININQNNQSITGKHIVLNVNTGDAYAKGKVILNIDIE
jgi:lipopolysaccharide transport protein LptA